MSTDSIVHWSENNEAHTTAWRSESGATPPRRILIGRDDMKADVAYRRACEGTAILWRGDFQNARQMLSAMVRRMKGKPRKQTVSSTDSPAQAFHLHRMAQSQRARTLGMLLIPFEADHSIPLRRAPDVRQPCLEAFGPAGGRAVPCFSARSAGSDRCPRMAQEGGGDPRPRRSYSPALRRFFSNSRRVR